MAHRQLADSLPMSRYHAILVFRLPLPSNPSKRQPENGFDKRRAWFCHAPLIPTKRCVSKFTPLLVFRLPHAQRQPENKRSEFQRNPKHLSPAHSLPASRRERASLFQVASTLTHHKPHPPATLPTPQLQYCQNTAARSCVGTRLARRVFHTACRLGRVPSR